MLRAPHTERATPPSQHRSELGLSIDRFFERAFQVERENRFQSAQEMAAAFEQAVAESPAVTGAPPLPAF